MIDVVGMGDGVPDSSGKREKSRLQRLSCSTLSCVACEICIWLCEKFGDFGNREREPGESLERERDCCGDFGNESLESHWKAG